MSILSAPFQAHLTEGTTTLSWAWRITRTDGVVSGDDGSGALLILSR